MIINESNVVHANVVMDPMKDMEQELFEDWRQEINALLDAELLRRPVHNDRRVEYRDSWHLPDHELRLEVSVPFVPFVVRGELDVEGQLIPWIAFLDLDESHTKAASIRKQICVFNVTQE